MKKTQKILAGMLAVTAAACFVGCEESSPVSSGEVNSVQQNTSITTTTNTLDDDINNPVDITEFVEDATLENPNITYFGYYDFRVAGDVKPAVKLFEETYGGKIDYYSCTWDERIDKLQLLISSDDSPDLVDREEVSFPYLVTKSVYEDLTDYIDLTQPHWQAYAQLVEQYEWNGGHYYYPFTATVLPDCLIYNKTVFIDLALDDPKELYENGNWTWDTFKQVMIDFVERQDNSTNFLQALRISEALIML